MPRLNIILAAADPARLYAALETALASAALGHGARLFLQGEAAVLLREPVRFAGDAARRAAGQPDLAGMIAEARAMEVDLFVCQSGMALAGVTADALVPEAKAAGLVSFLAEIGPGERLIVY
ncbi:MAG TPA: DsrE family protein [Sphingopyxis sp.]|nr:DsrE family protein [Sphingopyxis sp.]HMP44032.1 DsrE family protein [Sphingopyxis sp.]HMQ19190.1 DsrE family protein [Sphingopyxis sp.]